MELRVQIHYLINIGNSLLCQHCMCIMEGGGLHIQGFSCKPDRCVPTTQQQFFKNSFEIYRFPKNLENTENYFLLLLYFEGKQETVYF